jgi:hypothetical protein
MASPVGHTLAGVAIFYLGGGRRLRRQGQTSWRRLAPFLLLPNLPDVDFLMSYVLYDNARLLHGGMTHTLAFAAVCSLLIMPSRLFGSFFATFLLAFVLIGSHLFIDMSSGDPISGETGVGVMLFYPFSLERIRSPLVLFFGIRHRTIHDLLSIYNLLAVLWDSFLFLLTIVLYNGLRRLKFFKKA